jgi:tyrosine-protein kinase Etk/Wzc
MEKVPGMGNENLNYEHRERTLAEGLLYYWSVLWRYKWLIITLSILAAGASVSFAMISKNLPPERSPMPNTYRAFATLVVIRGDETGIASLMESLGIPTDTRGGLDYGQMAIRVLGSRSFLDTLVERFDIIERYGITVNVRSNSRGVISDPMELIYDRNTGVLTIAYTHIDPVFARDVVNETVTLLQEWFANRGSTAQERQTELVAAKLQEVGRKIEQLESEIEAFQKQYGVLRVEELANRQMSLLADLQSQLVLKEMEIETYQQISRIEDPNLVQLRAEYANLAKRIRELEEGSGTGIPGSRELPELARQFSKLNDDLEIQRRIYLSLSQQFEILRLNITNNAVFQVLEYAEVPDEKSGPQRGQMVVMVTGATFFLSVLLALALNALKKVKTQGKV